VVSPLLANIYLDALDAIWERRCQHLGVLVRGDVPLAVENRRNGGG
jgi:hypothetical protein